MCWEIDYKLLAEQEKAQETRIKQEQRAEVIDRLLSEANKQGEKTKVEETSVKEAAPAKLPASDYSPTYNWLGFCNEYS